MVRLCRARKKLCYSERTFARMIALFQKSCSASINL